ncbi:Dynein regulatory complex protein 11 [Homalodisca vitripennis]|nr:Dynein regulatory complex protein 11 [Homalodisca vitripennis]
MSHETYTRVWLQAQEILDDATRIDVDQQSAKPIKDKRLAHRIVGDLFLKYIRAINRLDECYDQVVQPQKRQLLRRLLDLSLGRYLELKHELVDLDLSEFSYFDDVMTEQRVLPSEAQVNIPNYYRRERAKEIADRRRTMDDILKKLGFYEEEFTGIEMTEDEAIRLIQIHERARQGRLRYLYHFLSPQYLHQLMAIFTISKILTSSVLTLQLDICQPLLPECKCVTQTGVLTSETSSVLTLQLDICQPLLPECKCVTQTGVLTSETSSVLTLQLDICQPLLPECKCVTQTGVLTSYTSSVLTLQLDICQPLLPECKCVTQTGVLTSETSSVLTLQLDICQPLLPECKCVTQTGVLTSETSSVPTLQLNICQHTGSLT